MTFGLLMFLGISGLFGGIGLIFGIWGLQLIPREPLDRIPFIDSWLAPGLVLVVVFGLGSLTAAYGIFRRPERPPLKVVQRLTGRPWWWAATVLLRLGQLLWLLVEWIYTGMSRLLILCGAVGSALTTVPFRRWLPRATNEAT